MSTGRLGSTSSLQSHPGSLAGRNISNMSPVTTAGDHPSASSSTSHQSNNRWPLHPLNPPKIIGTSVEITGMRLDLEGTLQYNVTHDYDHFKWVYSTDIANPEAAYYRFTVNLAEEEESELSQPKPWDEYIEEETTAGNIGQLMVPLDHIISELTIEGDQYYLVEDQAGEMHLMAKEDVKANHENLWSQFIDTSIPNFIGNKY